MQAFLNSNLFIGHGDMMYSMYIQHSLCNYSWKNWNSIRFGSTESVAVHCPYPQFNTLFIQICLVAVGIYPTCMQQMFLYRTRLKARKMQASHIWVIPTINAFMHSHMHTKHQIHLIPTSNAHWKWVVEPCILTVMPECQIRQRQIWHVHSQRHSHLHIKPQIHLIPSFNAHWKWVELPQPHFTTFNVKCKPHPICDI